MTDAMIDRWKSIYSEYMSHLNVPLEEQDDMWIEIIDGIINLWNQMERNEIPQIYDSFKHFLLTQMSHYERINIDYYRRNAYIRDVKKSNGGRYWI